MNWLAIFIGGGLGSVSRFGISYFFKTVQWQKNFPLATILTNILACLILAVTVYLFKDKINEQPWLYSLIGIGFCGGFSTFSTFSLESVQLFQDKLYFYAFMNIAASVIICFALMLFIAKQQG
ncbi:fluoride efflux transporter CrcB [Lishizhenia sp.]|uniref:fluoride efflux transporter CrcB n=1 Tax=Lishizhenia sp. TaxID=2497594 RepID=UPI00299F0ED8|nr:fluoride efflux transporter CrcB [Lishizhenia sp.]MDX1445362.1 fluoride efflux transporter CrcB [Lishizhenia sp.]